jgi:hypothetical protein
MRPRGGQTCHSGRRGATEMSVLRSRLTRLPRPDAQESRSVASVARRLQANAPVVPVLVLAACLSGTAGCVIPPDLEQQREDAGANAPPIVLSVRNEVGEYASPGPVRFERGTGSALVTVYDIDATDTLYVQFFVEYSSTNPTAPRSQCPAPPPATAGSLERQAVCDVRALCVAGDENAERPLFLEVEVYDRMPGNGGEPVFRDLPAGGLRSARSYLMICEEPSSS